MADGKAVQRPDTHQHTSSNTKQQGSTEGQFSAPQIETASVDFAQLNASPKAAPNHLLQLQRLIGNQAVQRYLQRQPATKRIQRCGADCKCEKCSQANGTHHEHSEEEDKPTDAPEAIQRTIGDKHDLKSPDVAGESKLEAAFDSEKSVRVGANGTEVAKLQSALLKLGFKLPVHGVDSKFGGETKSAVKQFQFTAGLEGDGIVGKLTMARLDEALLRPSPPTPPAGLTADDKKITGVSPRANKRMSQIFFNLNSFDPNDDPKKKEKIDALTQPANLGNPLGLKGVVSEDEAPALAQQRIDAVEALFKAAKHTGTRTPNPSPDDGKDRLDYRSARFVEMLPPGSSSSISPCAPTPGNPHPEVKPCAPSTIFTDAQAKALQIVTPVIAAMAGTRSPTTNAAIDRFFATTTTAKRNEVATKIRSNLTNLKQHVATQMTPERTTGPGHRCATDCDNGCSDAIAYNTGVGGSAEMVLCEIFQKTSDVTHRAETLLHEGMHGTEWAGAGKGSGADDFAYDSQRLIHFLDTETALKNNDTYIFFIQEVNNPGAVPARDPKSDPKNAGMSAAEGEQADRALAWCEGFIVKALQELSGLYADMDPTIRRGSWNTNSYAVDTMHLVARRFNLTPPPAAPTLNDKITVAALHDRIQRMDKITFNSHINLNKVAAPVTTWAKGPAKSIDLGQDFFSASSERARLDILMIKLVEATDGISAPMQTQYVAMIDELRTHSGLGSP